MAAQAAPQYHSCTQDNQKQGGGERSTLYSPEGEMGSWLHQDKPPHTRYKYLWVFMDTFSRWEAFFTQREGALTVVKTFI